MRRGEKDPLYHKVLERYVQLLVGHGGVTGFFIEGRLSRDGRLGAPKTGLLDYIIGVRRTWPGRAIWFVPVGVNFDRVLEDRNLVRERDGSVAPSSLDKARSLLRLLVMLPVLVGANLLRVAARSHRKFGYAAVVVGDPVPLDDLQGPVEVANLPLSARREHVKEVAQALLGHIGRVVPATPVTVFCHALLSGEERGEREVTRRVQVLLAVLRRRGVPMALGRAFSGGMAPSAGGGELAGLDDELAMHGEAELVVTLAGFALGRRKLVRHSGSGFALEAGAEPILRYYANSIAHHLA